jgi:excinuclease UvrABC nuclease subunit
MASAQLDEDGLAGFSDHVRFGEVDWEAVPDQCGVYIIYDRDEVVYVGMAGRDGGGSLRKRLKDHSSGQVVNMFAQYLFLARVQFTLREPARHPRAAKKACHDYIAKRCSFRCRSTGSAAEARGIENRLKRELKPALNATEALVSPA